MGSVAELVVSLVADASGYDKGTKQAEDDNTSLGKSSDSLGGKITSGFMSGAKAALGFAATAASIVGVGLSIQGVTSYLQGAVQGAEAMQAAQATTNQILASGSHVAGLTAQSIDQLSQKLMAQTGVDDDTVRGVENLLAGYNQISSKAFPQVTQAALDLARQQANLTGTAFNATDAAKNLGLALQSPANSSKLLRQYGIALTTQQQAQIKQFMAVNDVADAQGVIMQAVTDKVGGASAAYEKTAAGGMMAFQTAMGNVQKEIGAALLPGMTAILQAVLPVAQAFAAMLPGAIQALQGALGGLNLTGFIGPAAAMIQGNLLPTLTRLGGFVMSTLLPAIMQLAKWFMSNVLPVLGQVAGVIVGTLLPAVGNLVGTVMSQLLPAVEQLWNVLAPQVVPILQFLGGVITSVVVPAFVGLLTGVAGVINFIASNQDVLHALEIALGIVGAVILATLVPSFIAWAISAGAAAIATIAATLPILAVIAVIALLVLGIIELVKHWSDISAFFGKIASAVGTFVGNAFSALGTFFKNMLNSLTSWASGMWQKWENFNAMIESAVLALIGAVVGYFAGLPGRIGATLDNLRSLAAGKIADLKSAFQNGLADIAGFFSHIALALPHIKLPHFTISGNFSLNPPSIPTFGVNWFAQGGVFTSPSIIGVGEAGPEAVIPLSRAGGGAGVGGNGYQGPDTVVIEMDGVKLARAFMPHMVNAIRTSAGIRTI